MFMTMVVPSFLQDVRNYVIFVLGHYAVVMLCRRLGRLPHRKAESTRLSASLSNRIDHPLEEEAADGTDATVVDAPSCSCARGFALLEAYGAFGVPLGTWDSTDVHTSQSDGLDSASEEGYTTDAYADKFAGPTNEDNRLSVSSPRPGLELLDHYEIFGVEGGIWSGSVDLEVRRGTSLSDPIPTACKSGRELLEHYAVFGVPSGSWGTSTASLQQYGAIALLST